MELTFAENISAMFYLVKAATPDMKPGSAIINTASVNAEHPSPHLLAYATTKGAIQNFTGGLAPVAGRQKNPGQPRRTGAGLDSTDPLDHAGRAGGAFRGELPDQASSAAARVSTRIRDVGSNEASYVSGTMIGVTGGKPIL
jgi:NAD(P)-dependent dehydrogenase (short-subunit alcohol dehydrogenase family)